MSKNPWGDFSYEGDSGLIVGGFHGTTLKNALNILRVGFQKFAGILGIAAYFDVGDVSSAIEKALEKSRPDASLARIIEVELHLGKSLDFQAPEIVTAFKEWQAEFRKRIGEVVYRQTTFSFQKEQFLTEAFPDIDSAILKDSRNNQIIGMRNSERIRFLNMRALSLEEVTKWTPNP